MVAAKTGYVCIFSVKLIQFMSVAKTCFKLDGPCLCFLASFNFDAPCATGLCFRKVMIGLLRSGMCCLMFLLGLMSRSMIRYWESADLNVVVVRWSLML